MFTLTRTRAAQLADGTNMTRVGALFHSRRRGLRATAVCGLAVGAALDWQTIEVMEKA